MFGKRPWWKESYLKAKEGKMKRAFFALLVFGIFLSSCRSTTFSANTSMPSLPPTVTTQRYVNPVEILRGTVDTVFIEGFGLLEYELYSVPIGGSDDFFAFIYFIYIPLLENGHEGAVGKYIFDLDPGNVFWRENNTALSYNVRRMMFNHRRNLSVTRWPNSDGSWTFTFNAHTNEGNFELYQMRRVFRR